MPDKSVEAQQPQLPEFKNSPDFRQVYCNSVNMEISPWEFKFAFGNLVKPKPGETRATVENAIEIIASPQLAKALLNLLASNMQEYEKNVGAINLPTQAPQSSPPKT